MIVSDNCPVCNRRWEFDTARGDLGWRFACCVVLRWLETGRHIHLDVAPGQFEDE